MPLIAVIKQHIKASSPEITRYSLRQLFIKNLVDRCRDGSMPGRAIIRGFRALRCRLDMTSAPPGPRLAQPPLVLHVLYRFDTGGLENGVVNLINRMPADRFRHDVVCLAGYSDFRDRIERPDTGLLSINKREGKDPAA